METASWVDSATEQLRAAATGEKRLAPAFVRLALHDALTYDVTTKTGGANGSIRVERELQHPGNEGLEPAIAVLDTIKKTLDSNVTHADLIQLAGVVGVAAMQGPFVAFVPGRSDSRVSPPRGRLPNDPAKANFKAAMQRTGLPPRLFVALAGAAPMGMHWGNTGAELAWEPRKAAFDNTFFKALVMPGGPSVRADPALTEDPELKTWVEAYARDQRAWHAAYAEAFAAASVLGTSLQAGAGGARGRGVGPTRGSAASSMVQASYGQLVTGAMIVGVACAAVGYWLGKRRRRRWLA